MHTPFNMVVGHYWIAFIQIPLWILFYSYFAQCQYPTDVNQSDMSQVIRPIKLIQFQASKSKKQALFCKLTKWWCPGYIPLMYPVLFLLFL